MNEKSKYFEKLVLGESSFGGEYLESKNKEYALFNPNVSRNTLANVLTFKTDVKEKDFIVSISKQKISVILK